MCNRHPLITLHKLSLMISSTRLSKSTTPIITSLLMKPSSPSLRQVPTGRNYTSKNSIRRMDIRELPVCSKHIKVQKESFIITRCSHPLNTSATLNRYKCVTHSNKKALSKLKLREMLHHVPVLCLAKELSSLMGWPLPLRYKYSRVFCHKQLFRNSDNLQLFKALLIYRKTITFPIKTINHSLRFPQEGSGSTIEWLNALRINSIRRRLGHHQ